MQRQNDPWLLSMQIVLPLLILAALNPQPQAQLLHQPAKNVSASEVVLLESWHAAAWDTLLLQDTAQAKWQQVIADANMAGRWNLLSDSGKMLLGDAYYHTGQNSLALNAWFNAGQAGGTARFEKMLQLQRASGDLNAALGTLNLWLSIDPQNSVITYQKALLQVVLSPQEATATLERALLLDVAYQKQVQTLKQALAAGAAQPESYRQVVAGRALASLGEWQLAHAVFQKAVSGKADYAEAWAFLGESDYQLGQDDFPSLTKALALDPHSTAAQSLMGLHWIRLGQPEKALAIFQQLVKQEPRQAVWELQSGDALARMGQPALAMVHYQNAVRLEPGNPQNWMQLTQFCLQNDLEVRRIGLPSARRLVMLLPDDPASYDLHGRVLLALGDQDDAQQAFFRGLKVNPISPLLFLDLGVLEINRQHNSEAFYDLSRAVELGQQQKEKQIVNQAQSLINQLH